MYVMDIVMLAYILRVKSHFDRCTKVLKPIGMIIFTCIVDALAICSKPTLKDCDSVQMFLLNESEFGAFLFYSFFFLG